MVKLLSILAICVGMGVTTGSVIGIPPIVTCDHDLLTVLPCEGQPRNCTVTPGQVYRLVLKYSSDLPPPLTLRIETDYMGIPVSLVDTVLSNNSVQPGVGYDFRMTFAPNDIFACQNMVFRTSIFAGQVLKACGSTNVHVACPVFVLNS